MVTWLKRGVGLYLCLILAGFMYPAAGIANAETAQSNSYRFSESSIGAGGLIESNSANFQSRSSIGDLAIGESASTNFQVNPGPITTPDPSLSFALNSSAVNFGNFTSSSATVATTTFSVSNYTSYGYVVQVLGTSLKNGATTIPAMATSGPSVVGTEQFGINVVANTSPVSFGANPDIGQFGQGGAAPNYGTANNFRYVSGETIALAPKTSGITTFTISYLVNVGNLTPGGQYTSDQTLIVTGTY